jgi:hypothetical protein
MGKYRQSIESLERCLVEGGNLKVNKDNGSTLELYFDKSKGKWVLLAIDNSTWEEMDRYDVFADAIQDLAAYCSW